MADKVAGLKLQIDAEVQNALKGVGDLDASVNDLAASAVGLNKDLGKTETAADAVAKELNGLGDDAKLASTAIDDFAILGGKSIAALRKEQDKARAAFKRLEDSGEQSLGEIARAGNMLDKTLEELEKEIEDVDYAADKIDGGGFAELLFHIKSAAAAAFGLQQALAAVGDYAGFEDDLLAVKALSGASADEFERLKTAAYDLSGAAGGPKAIAAAMSELAASGSDVDEILGSVDIVGKLSGASRGALDFKASGDLLTNTVKQLGLGMDSAGAIADRLAKGWNSAGHDGAELGEALTEVLPIVTSLYGHMGDTAPLEKSVAVINVLAEVYKKGGAAGTAFNGILASLIKPVGEGAEVLDKYKDKIKVFDDTGRLRDFADIVKDIGASGMTSSEQLAVFGREAGPAMTALLGAGSQAIRDMESQLKSADGTVGATSQTLQDGLGGSLREATAEIEKARLAMVEDFLPALQGVLSLAKYADNAIAGLSGTIKTGAAIWSASLGVVTKILSAGEYITDMIGLTDDSTKLMADSSAAAFASAKDLGDQASASFKKAKGEIDPLVESQNSLNAANTALKQTFAAISRETGVTVASMAEVDAAVASGAIRQDEATGKWIGAEKEKQEAIDATARKAALGAELAAKAEEAARKKASAAWQDYLKTVSSITDQVAQRSGILGLSDELAQLKASQLSAADGYQQIKDRVKELGDASQAAFAEAEKLASQGDTEGAVALYGEALKYADEAKDKAKELNTAVEDGDKTIVSQKEGFENATAAVTEYGELGIKILEKWKESAQDAADTLDKEFNFSGLNDAAQAAADKAGKIGPALAGGIKTGVDAGVADAGRLEAALDAAAKDRTANLTITERTVQAKFHGGLIASSRDLRAGAQVYGPTGYDSVHALLAGDEAVTQSKRVRELGYSRVMRPINEGQYDKAIAGIAAYLGPAATRDALASYLLPPAMDMAMAAPPSMPRLDPVHGAGSAGQKIPNLGTIILQNDRTGDRFSVYAKPQDAPKLAAFLDDPTIIRHGRGGR